MQIIKEKRENNALTYIHAYVCIFMSILKVDVQQTKSEIILMITEFLLIKLYKNFRVVKKLGTYTYIQTFIHIWILNCIHVHVCM